MMGKFIATFLMAAWLVPCAMAQEGGEVRGRKGEKRRDAAPPPTAVRPTANATAPSGQTITGVVIDSESGEGMIGATVTVRNTANAVVHGAMTDYDGSFKIKLDTIKYGVINVSFVGYKEITVPLDLSNLKYEFEMTVQVYDLEEVVVVGYGTQSRKDVSGSISKVTSETLRLSPVSSLDQAMQGRAAGLQLQQNSGMAGGGASVRIRGAASISATNQPLYVVDGVPLLSGDFTQLDYNGQTVDAVADIDPNSIESIDILKDAAASAIYGSRAANGVIMITTKRGSAGKTRFNFNAYWGFQQVWRQKKFLNTSEYRRLWQDMFYQDSILTQELYGYNINEDGLFNGDDYMAAYHGVNIPLRPGPDGKPRFYEGFDGVYGKYKDSDFYDTNWFDEVLRTAPIQSYELSASGGDVRTKYAVMLNYFDQVGIVRGNDYKRYSARLNLDHSVNDKLSLGASAMLARSINNRIISDNTVFGPFANAIAAAPIYPVKLDNGEWSSPNYTNPRALAELVKGEAANLRILGNVFANYEIISGLNAKIRLATDLLNIDERRFIPGSDALPLTDNPTGFVYQGHTTVRKWLTEGTLDYFKRIKDTHQITALLGTAWEKNDNEPMNASGLGVPGQRFQYLGSAAVVNSGSGERNGYQLASYFSRFGYSYKDKYIISLNFRMDGASRFGADNRWAPFFGASVAWRVKEENFLKDVSIISDLKIRFSAGTTGNQEIGNFRSIGLYTSGVAYNGQPGIYPLRLPNPGLTWESTVLLDAGFDLALLNNRIALIFDFYNKTTNNLLFARPSPVSMGYPRFFDNVGSVRNTGVEFSVNTENITPKKRGSFGWQSSLNLTFNRNEVTQLYNDQPQDIGLGGITRITVGQPLGTFFGYKSDGLYQTKADVPGSPEYFEKNGFTQEQIDAFNDAGKNMYLNGVRPGDVRFVDTNGDGLITSADRVILGNSQPIFFGGFTNIFTFKGFELNLFLQFSYGNKTFNGILTYAEAMNFTDNSTGRVLDRWRSESEPGDGNMPRATGFDPNNNARLNSDRFLEDGSYLRFKTVTLGYYLPQSVLSKIKLQSLKIYVSAMNLLTFTRYSGFDPEVNAMGGSPAFNSSSGGSSNAAGAIDFYTVPQPRTITFGINVGF